MLSRFVSKLEDFVTKSDCATCAHKYTTPYLPACDAFPYGIPEQLLSGELQHRTPFQNDHGIMYEPIKEE